MENENINNVLNQVTQDVIVQCFLSLLLPEKKLLKSLEEMGFVDLSDEDKNIIAEESKIYKEKILEVIKKNWKQVQFPAMAMSEGGYHTGGIVNYGNFEPFGAKPDEFPSLLKKS